MSGENWPRWRRRNAFQNSNIVQLPSRACDIRRIKTGRADGVKGSRVTQYLFVVLEEGVR